jgi:hypothetical protein
MENPMRKQLPRRSCIIQGLSTIACATDVANSGHSKFLETFITLKTAVDILSRISAALATSEITKEQTIYQRLREWKVRTGTTRKQALT